MDAMTLVQINDYLARIGLDASTLECQRDLGLVKKLIWSHQKMVPFENLDIHYDTSILLDYDRIFQKIVNDHRGGFCYELNSTFYRFLKSIGYDVQILSGRVVKKDGINFAPEYDHLTVSMKLDGDSYLVDVGMGDFSKEPVPIGDNTENHDGISTYYVQKRDEYYYLVRKQNEKGEKENKYLFTLTPRSFNEFNEMCRWQQTSPESHFRKNKFVTIKTDEGHVTLTDQKLIKVMDGVRTEETVNNEKEFRALLLKHFQITLRQPI